MLKHGSGTPCQHYSNCENALVSVSLPENVLIKDDAPRIQACTLPDFDPVNLLIWHVVLDYAQHLQHLVGSNSIPASFLLRLDGVVEILGKWNGEDRRLDQITNISRWGQPSVKNERSRVEFSGPYPAPEVYRPRCLWSTKPAFAASN